jgi:hypothetical protein
VHQRLVRIQWPLQKHLHLAAGFLDGEQARGNHARVVEHQEVAWRDELRQIAHLPIGQRPAGAVEGQQATRRSLGERLLGYEFGWEFVGEVGTAHGGEFTAMRRTVRRYSSVPAPPGTAGTGGSGGIAGTGAVKK